MPGPWSSNVGSGVSNSSVPIGALDTTVRTSRPVFPFAGSVATTLSTSVPPITGTVAENAPPGPAAVVVAVTAVAVSASMFTALTTIRLPAFDVPVTVTESPTRRLSAGAVTVSGVSPCVCRT